MKIDFRNILEISNIREKKHIVFIIIVILITAFFGKKIWEKQKDQLIKVQEEIVTHKRMMSLGDEINSLFKVMDKFKSVGWPTGESIEIMGEVNNLASKHNIEIVTFDPAKLNNLENYSTLAMTLNIKADYFNLARFLSELEELKTLIKVSYLDIQPEGSTAQEEGPLVRANLTLVAFIFRK